MGPLIVGLMLLACIGTLPVSFAREEGTAGAPRRFERTNPDRALLPPWWAPHTDDEEARRDAESTAERAWLGTDRLGRDMLWRCLAGGAISLTVGFIAAIIAVVIGTAYGSIAGWRGGSTDAAMMRIVDVLYGLPYVLLVVLLAVAMDGLIENAAAARRLGADDRGMVDAVLAFIGEHKDAARVATLLVAIGGVSWLTMARVIRGQVLSLKHQPFMEACRAIGVPIGRQFTRHLLPNLAGPITVYATLTVPTAILSESFLSFLGIGVQEPLPSWGNLASAGLSELNPVRMRWWLLLWPCLFVAVTLLALNFMGEALRERLDPRRTV